MSFGLRWVFRWERVLNTIMTDLARKNILLQLLKTVFGLVLFSFGVSLTIHADIGLAPWDALSMGISFHTPLSYGTAHTLISCLILAVDLLMRERVGWGTLFDAFLVGLCADFFRTLGLFPDPAGLIDGALFMIVGLFIMALGQYFYMSSAQCCGPRDTFLVAIGKRLPRLPIGAVNTIILCAVLAAGWMLGAPIGVGTLLSTFGIGVAMQIVFRLFRFEPRSIRHRDLLETTAALLGHATGEPH